MATIASFKIPKLVNEPNVSATLGCIMFGPV